MLPTDIAPELPPEVAPELAPVAPIVTGDRVRARILQFHKKNLTVAVQSTTPLWAAIQMSDDEYQSAKFQPNAINQKPTDAEIDVPEAGNQVDIVVANFMDNLTQNGEMYIAVADGGETQERADTTKQVMDSFFDRNEIYRENEVAAHRFTSYRLAGVKSILEYKEDVRGERISVEATPDALAEVQQLSTESGIPARPTAMVAPDPTMPEVVTDVLFEVPNQQGHWNVFYRALEMRNMAFNDLNSLYRTGDVHRQYAVHEFHYWTREEMESVGGFNRLDDLGQPDAGTRRHPEQANSRTSEAQTQKDENFQPYEIVESWSRLPIQRWVRDKEFTQEEVTAFAREEGLDPNEFNVQQLFAVYHDKKCTTIIKTLANYIPRKLRFPYNTASYRMGGGSYMEQILSACKAMKVLKNLYLFNVRARAKGGVLVEKNCDIDVDIVKKVMYEDGGVGEVELGSRPIEQLMVFVAEKIPDAAPAVVPMLGLLKGDVETFGTPSIMSGKGEAETATTNAINNSRGQQKLNNPYRRYVQMLRNAWDDCRDLIHMNLTEGMWITIAGEAGVAMARQQFVRPTDISNSFKIIPTATYDFADRNAKAQQLIAMLNIDARTPFMGPETYFKQKAGILEYMGFPRKQVDEWTNNAGMGTDPMEEIRVMITNPQRLPEIRPDDPHKICVFLAMDAIKQDAVLGAARDPNFRNLSQQWNFKQYIKMHEMYAAMMAAEEAAQAEAEGGDKPGEKKPEKKTAPQNNPNPPTTQQGTEARQPGQFNSPADGGMSALGMTGQGGMAAMGGQLPNSISGMVN